MWGHLFCGVNTNIVTGVDATPGSSNDALFLRPLVADTARHFNIAEVSVDGAYLSRGNLRAVQAVGVIPYMSVKTNSVGRWGHHK